MTERLGGSRVLVKNKDIVMGNPEWQDFFLVDYDRQSTHLLRHLLPAYRTFDHVVDAGDELSW